MTRSTVMAILERIATDLAFRRRFEKDAAEALADYVDLASEERQLLLHYASIWLEEQRIGACPSCGGLAVVRGDGSVLRCPSCAPE